MKATINSEKHIVQYPIDAIMAGNFKEIDIIKVEETPSAAQDVRVGAVIKAIYVELWLIGGDQQLGSQVMIVEKLPADSPGIGFGGMATLNDNANKKNVFFTTMGLLGDNNSNPTPVIRGWIKIPKGKQRFGLGDRMRIAISSQAGEIEYCGQSIFKEYF